MELCRRYRAPWQHSRKATTINQPTPSVNSSIAMSQATQKTHHTSRTQPKVVYVAEKSTRSSAHTNIHAWNDPVPPTPNEHDVNPNPGVYFYCYVHRFNLSHARPQCARMKHNPTEFTAKQIASIHPHAAAPVGCRRMQKKSDE
jgi:hypothetical protein